MASESAGVSVTLYNLVHTIIDSPRSAQNITLPPIPELFDPNFLDALLPPSESTPPQETAPTESEVQNKMMDSLRSTAHRKHTENGAPAFSSTLSSPLMHTWYLERAWVQDPALTLRIIWRCRSIHDGQADRELFYRAFGWLYKHHPRTAIANLRYLVEPLCARSAKNKTPQSGLSHGYWKDLLNILALATVDELSVTPLDPRSTFLHNYVRAGSRPIFKSNGERNRWSRKQHDERFAKAHSRLLEKLMENRYRALYISVSQLFSEKLSRDSRVLHQLNNLPPESKERKKLEYTLSLAPKWAPTPGGAHDRITNICSAICLLLHHHQVTLLAHNGPKLSPENYSPLQLHVLRCAYQKCILTPARSTTQLPEPLMSANRWSEVSYPRVASLCMQANKARFFTRDRERFVKYLADVESSKRTISGATLLPHTLVMQAVRYARELANPESFGVALAETQLRVVDAQWAMLLSRLRESGTLDKCIAVCDVSGSMGSVRGFVRRVRPTFSVYPIWPALSLSLIIARLSKPPFRDAFITFSRHLQLVELAPAEMGIAETVIRMSNARWEMNTDFEAVFLRLILPLAVKHQVPKEEMIKRFDASQNNGNDVDWKTNHDVIERACAEKEGVAMLSGYSPALLKTFMDVDDDWEVVDKAGDKIERTFTPEGMMKRDLQKRSFEPLVVID
ncbi:hypothetical protein EDC04DRAFT_2883774 [Pisolithus marmoratus]|nr:hypothetical protein EDC04DRAFT_2883774 [Pisolithus marmoratus]